MPAQTAHPGAFAPPRTPRPAAPPSPPPPPAPAQPESLPWLRPRQTFPDQQVWPPPPRPADDGPGTSTQPFPSIPSPLPPGFAAGTAPAFQPAGTAAPPSEDGSEAGTPAEPEEASPAAAPAPRRRTALRIAGTVVAVALAAGVPTLDDYLFYRLRYPVEQVHVVAAGATVKHKHVAWQVKVEPKDSVDGQAAKPGRKWLQITVVRTSLDQQGVLRRADPTIKVVHPDGRNWQALVSDHNLPLEAGEHKIGTPYRYNVVAVVPAAVAGEVEVQIIPSTAELPIEEVDVADLFKPDPQQKEQEPQDQVLLFRR
ncbi:hypothetical protein ACFFMN_09400 [Planobispora siamensis]|uniref:hypothetical protein n=1 Tax=Planobispora siamensis TaxID=936338 RepID=UPI0019502DE6|nr:hypothetical protein [Planobispora siamensis]